jgi:hypothetical protein
MTSRWRQADSPARISAASPRPARRWSWLGLGLAGLALVAVGACGPEAGASGGGWLGNLHPKPPQIVRVVCIYRQDPFRSYDAEGDPNPEGFSFTLYLESHKTGKGVLADGTLRAKMYAIERDSQGESSRRPVQDWSVSLDKVPRSKKPSVMGWAYVPQFVWGDNADILGKEVEVVVSYEAPDGRIVRGQTKRLLVPHRRY